MRVAIGLGVVLIVALLVVIWGLWYPVRPRVMEGRIAELASETLAADADTFADVATPIPEKGVTEDEHSVAEARGLHAEAVRIAQEGDYGRAASRFAQAVRLAPRNAEYRNDYGWALYQSGELTAAQRELEAAIQLDPRRPSAYANLGDVLLALDDPARAIAAYQRYVEMESDPRQRRNMQTRLDQMRRER